MHEFSLASEIIDIVLDSLRNAGKKQVNRIELDIGELSGVEVPALDMALKSLMNHPALKNAKIIRHRIKGKAICLTCKNEFELNDFFSVCPHCQGIYKDIISGREFNVRRLEVE
ncbi:MAG: hydrogenase maturation nickel metallochaperone HypA [Bacteroidales bacterium]|nr:hydrogenase maturation nickel metallochaperone HypA [Bacteroidales bacterium]MBN2818979.1 hydrogenase maturation nickel metallochaperone HypA [Bacteroidales bacterium]